MSETMLGVAMITGVTLAILLRRSDQPPRREEKEQVRALRHKMEGIQIGHKAHSSLEDPMETTPPKSGVAKSQSS